MFVGMIVCVCVGGGGGGVSVSVCLCVGVYRGVFVWGCVYSFLSGLLFLQANKVCSCSVLI